MQQQAGSIEFCKIVSFRQFLSYKNVRKNGVEFEEELNGMPYYFEPMAEIFF